MRQTIFVAAAKQTKSKRCRSVAKRGATTEALERRTLMASIVVTSTADDGAGTLRQAITAANADPAPDTITFKLRPNARTINLASPLPDLITDMNLNGPGAGLLTVRRNTGGDYRIFTITGGTIGISGMTLSNGVSGQGGAMQNDGSLTILGCTITGNSASSGAGIFNNGSLTIDDSTLSGNTCYLYGGALFNVGQFTISDSTINGNAALQFGGGGGILNEGASQSTLINCTLTDNVGAFGGALTNQGPLTIISSTISRNSSNFGGGILNQGPLTLSNTIVALNTAGFGPDILDQGTFTDTGGNFIGGDPLLGPLVNNGGPTLTMALLPGSPCVNAGDNDVVLSDTDQRGMQRVQAYQVDIGAYEYNAFRESLVVTTNVDEYNSTSDPAFGTGTSLREALYYASGQEGNHTITFALGAGQHTINLAGGLDVPANVDIHGPGAGLLTIRRNTGGDYRIFTIQYFVDCRISGMTIADGSSGNGGGIWTTGTLALTNCVVSNNRVAHQSSGAGIFNGGTLTVTDCTFSSNHADDGSSGAVIANFGTLSIQRSTIRDNYADGLGGGIYNDAYAGGPCTISNCTFSGNTARFLGGGIYNDAGNVLVSSSTIVGNTVNIQGGGIANNAGGIANNAFLTLQNSIVAANGLGDLFGAFVDGGYNFIGDTDGDPKLGPLADNGGPTQTMALLPGSPCINAGDPDFVSLSDFDQRGAPYARVFGRRIDIGAYEFGLEELNLLRTQVRALPGLNGGNINSLLSKLALKGNHGDIGKVQTFISEAQGLFKTGKISRIDLDLLLTAAAALQTSLS